MFKKPSAKQYRILAVIWALAAASMAVSVVRRLPQLSPLHLLLMAVSLFVAASSWKSWKVHRKAEEENRLEQERLKRDSFEQDIPDQDIQDQDMEDERND